MLDQFFLESHTGTRDAAHDMLLYQGGGALVGCAILNGILLRYTQDIGVWKIAQASILAIDLSLLAGTYEVFGNQGRLSPMTWQVGDWVGMIITIGVTVARISFLAELGFKKQKTK